MAGEADLFHPVIYDNMNRVDMHPHADYYASTDITDKAIEWVRPSVRWLPTSRFSSTTPPSAPTARSKFQTSGATGTKASSTRVGIRCERKRWPGRSKWASCLPGTDLAPKPAGIQEWDQLTADEKKVFARYMEIYAAFAEVTDYEVGRFVEAIEDLGEMDNTLIFYITGDNGSVFQGGPHRCL